MSPRPVTSHENEAVKGQALIDQKGLEKNREKVDELRAQHAEYLASLPTEPKDCMDEALRALGPDGGNYPEGFEEAMHLSHTLAPMIHHLDASQPGPEREAMLYVAERICVGLFNAAAAINHAGEALANPGRLAWLERREQEMERWKAAL